MIKCNATVCGVVSKTATCRTNSEGKPSTSFAVNVVVPARSGINKTIEISVMKDGEDAALMALALDTRIDVKGVLTFKKRGDNLYFNLTATSVEPVFLLEDCIGGEMHFRGKVGKTIEEKTDKNGKPYVQFPAFSSEKLQDGFEYLWVRFIRFDKEREEWLQPGVKIEAKGAMELSVFNDRLNLSCRMNDLKEYVQPPYNPNNQ